MESIFLVGLNYLCIFVFSAAPQRPIHDIRSSKTMSLLSPSKMIFSSLALNQFLLLAHPFCLYFHPLYFPHELTVSRCLSSFFLFLSHLPHFFCPFFIFFLQIVSAFISRERGRGNFQPIQGRQFTMGWDDSHLWLNWCTKNAPNPHIHFFPAGIHKVESVKSRGFSYR